MKKLFALFSEIGNIMYVGGILSHIVIGVMCVGASPEFVYSAYMYKEMSMYALIIPGLVIKIILDMVAFFVFKERAYWFYLKTFMLFILTFNAVVFLIPMMPEMLVLAKESLKLGYLNESFLQKESFEALIGQCNALPLLLEVLLGVFKPKIRGR